MFSPHIIIFAYEENFRLIYWFCLAWQLTVGWTASHTSIIYSLTQQLLLHTTTGICTYRWIYLFVFLLLLNMCIIWQVHFGRIVNVSDLNFDNKLWRGILPCPVTGMFLFTLLNAWKNAIASRKKGFQRRSSRGKNCSLVLRHMRALFHSSFF